MGNIIDISEVLLELGLSSSVTDEERAMTATAITRAEGAVKRHLRYDPVQRTRTEYYPQTGFGSSARETVWEVENDQAIQRRLAEASVDELQVQHIPIRSITTLAIDLDGRSGTSINAFPVSSEKVEGTDFWPNYDGQDSSNAGICRDGIIRSFGRWPLTAGSVRIVYVAGYTAAELHGQDSIVDASPIMDAVLEESARRLRKAMVWKKQAGAGFPAGPFTSEKLGDYSYTIDASTANRMFGGSWDIIPETIQKLEAFLNWGYPIGA